jgi:hypothetical protein
MFHQSVRFSALPKSGHHPRWERQQAGQPTIRRKPPGFARATKDRSQFNAWKSPLVVNMPRSDTSFDDSISRTSAPGAKNPRGRPFIFSSTGTYRSPRRAVAAWNAKVFLSSSPHQPYSRTDGADQNPLSLRKYVDSGLAGKYPLLRTNVVQKPPAPRYQIPEAQRKSQMKLSLVVRSTDLRGTKSEIEGPHSDRGPTRGNSTETRFNSNLGSNRFHLLESVGRRAHPGSAAFRPDESTAKRNSTAGINRLVERLGGKPGSAALSPASDVKSPNAERLPTHHEGRDQTTEKNGPTTQKRIPGEIWLDTIALKDWVQTNIIDEFGRTSGAEGRSAGSLGYL